MPDKVRRKEHLLFCRSEESSSAFVSRARKPARDGETVREVRLRLPNCVVEQLQDVASVERCSMNAVAADYIDQGFRRGGYKRIDELAPTFADYLRGERKRDEERATQREPQSKPDDQADDTAILPVKFT